MVLGGGESFDLYISFYFLGGEELGKREGDRRDKGEENDEKDEELKAKKEAEINDMQENCIVARNYCLLH